MFTDTHCLGVSEYPFGKITQIESVDQSINQY